MSEGGATARLGQSGVGVIVGGVVLAVALLGLPFPAAAAVVCLGGVGWLALGDGQPASQRGIGVLAVGAIGLVEAAGLGLGLTPFALAGLAVVFGLFDVVAGRVLGSLRRDG